jgi:vancomycin resistance protein YoaR
MSQRLKTPGPRAAVNMRSNLQWIFSRTPTASWWWRRCLAYRRNSLTIEGEAAIDMPQGMEAIHAEVHATRYSRNFVLSGELETDAVDAKLKDGVLTIRIPKRREYRPRKVEVRTD